MVTMILFLFVISGHFNEILGMDHVWSADRAGQTSFSDENWRKLQDMCRRKPIGSEAGMLGMHNHQFGQFGAPRFKRGYPGEIPIPPVMTPEAQLQQANLRMNLGAASYLGTTGVVNQGYLGTGMTNAQYTMQQMPGMHYRHHDDIIGHHLHEGYSGNYPTFSNMVYYFYDSDSGHMVDLMDDLQQKFKSTDPAQQVKFFTVHVSHNHKEIFKAKFRAPKLPYFAICKEGALILEDSEEKVIRKMIDDVLTQPMAPMVQPAMQNGMQGGMQQGRMPQGGMGHGNEAEPME